MRIGLTGTVRAIFPRRPAVEDDGVVSSASEDSWLLLASPSSLSFVDDDVVVGWDVLSVWSRREKTRYECMMGTSSGTLSCRTWLNEPCKEATDPREMWWACNTWGIGPTDDDDEHEELLLPEQFLLLFDVVWDEEVVGGWFGAGAVSTMDPSLRTSDPTSDSTSLPSDPSMM